MQKEASDRPPVLLCGLASGSLILQLQLPQVMTALGCVERETGREGGEVGGSSFQLECKLLRRGVLLPPGHHHAGRRALGRWGGETSPGHRREV